MQQAIPASEYIHLGETVFASNNPQLLNAEVYVKEVGKLFAALQNCGFDDAYTAANTVGGGQIYSRRDGLTHDTSVGQLQPVMLAASRILYRDADKRLTINLKTTDVSAKLRELGNHIPLNNTQKHLQEETIRCIESEAYRAGAVMGWGLAYDWIRRWVWDDPARQGSFNAELMTWGKGQRYPNGLTAYDDFYSIRPFLSERDVLDAMKGAGLLTGVYDKLCHYLGERNSFAHANSLVPSPHQTNHYIDSLIDLIRGAPFA